MQLVEAKTAGARVILELRFLVDQISLTYQERCEWPPHPHRIFQALTQAWGDGGCRPEERQALSALCALAPPELSAPEALESEPYKVYVPLNGNKSIVLRDSCKRAVLRRFMCVDPAQPLLYIWQETLASPLWQSLQRLCEGVVYLGTSSTMVSARLLTEFSGQITHRPGTGKGGTPLRVLDAELLNRLEAVYAQRKVTPEVSAIRGDEFPVTQDYFEVREVPERKAPAGTLPEAAQLRVFHPKDKSRLPLELTTLLTEAVWGTIHNITDGKAPEIVTGHAPDGSPSKRTHLGIVPLPDVGHQQATGNILGFAAIIPPGLSYEELRVCHAVLDELGQARIQLGNWGVWDLVETKSPKRSLQPSTWNRSSTSWRTVSPIVLDQYPRVKGQGKKPQDSRTQELIAQACIYAGLPRPSGVSFSQNPFISGVPRASVFRALPERPGRQRLLLHALLEFAEPVKGPVVLGAGRFRGLGLCLSFED
jgi:CRISPR-associated protein Csb2